LAPEADKRRNESGEHVQSAGWFTRNVFNRIVAGASKLGLGVAGSQVLEVTGRSSGEPRRTPVNPLPFEDELYLVAPRGHVQWVKNVRVKPEARLLHGRKARSITVAEVPDADKAPLLRAYLEKWAWEVGVFFDGVGADASDEELLRIAPDHPAFKVTFT
jgi:deazaflavin-dependent oxidoreductase (nitroreductase family)